MSTEPATRESVVAELMSDASSAIIEGTAVDVTDAPVEAATEESPTEGETEIEAQPEADDPDAPEAASEGEGEEVEPERPAIEPPHFWSAEAKARFGELPYELQLVVQENEKAGSKATTQKLEEAALAKKAAETQAEALAALAERIAAAAEQAETTFASRWRGMDQAAWLKLSRDDATQYTQLRAQYEAEQYAVQRANAAKDATQAVERDRWRAEQIDRLKTLQPELVDPVKGPELLTALGSYLVKQGVAEQDLPNVGALEMSVAWKAMKFDELQTLKPMIKPQPKAALRPGAAPPATPSVEREVQALRNRFAQTGTREDAVALMLAEEKLKQ